MHTRPTKATAAVVGVGVSAIDRFLAGDGSALTPGTAADCTCQTSPTRAFPILDDHSRRAAIKSPDLIVSRAPPLPATYVASAPRSLLVASSAETDAHNHRPSVAHSSRRLIKHESEYFRVMHATVFADDITDSTCFPRMTSARHGRDAHVCISLVSVLQFHCAVACSVRRRRFGRYPRRHLPLTALVLLRLPNSHTRPVRPHRPV